LLDVGGVLVLPDRELVSAALIAAAVEHDPERVDEAHYRAMRATDEHLGDLPEGAYGSAYRRALGIAPTQDDRAREALEGLFARPASEIWRQLVPGSFDAVRRLVDLGLRVGIVSNADGTVAALLSALGICQVGSGPATPVAAIVDSGVVGAEKPDPRIFRHALDSTGSPARTTVFVGDSERTDVRGAVDAGLTPVHVDPLGICPRQDEHLHVSVLSELEEVLQMI
jgi:putative hydrolase of the HAD superfamily